MDSTQCSLQNSELSNTEKMSFDSSMSDILPFRIDTAFDAGDDHSGECGTVMGGAGERSNTRLRVQENTSEREEAILGFGDVSSQVLVENSVKNQTEAHDDSRLQRLDMLAKANRLTSSRYFVHENMSRKFDHIKPGSFPSEALSRALGDAPHVLPQYVYRLRMLGYPPAWLEEARIKRAASLHLYSKTDEYLESTMDLNNDGHCADSELLFDESKLICWPGFNGAMPCRGRHHTPVADEHRYYNCPPYNNHQGLNHMLQDLKRRSHRRRRTVKSSKRKEPVSRSVKNGAPLKVSTRVSDSHSCLETSGFISEGDDSLSASRPDKMNIDLATVEKADVVDETIRDAEPKIGSESPENSARCLVLEEIQGTPIVQHYSPFRSLPDREKWATGTTDHILFENLPDSTGAWANMRTVLKRTRSALRQAKDDRRERKRQSPD